MGVNTPKAPQHVDRHLARSFRRFCPAIRSSAGPITPSLPASTAVSRADKVKRTHQPECGYCEARGSGYPVFALSALGPVIRATPMSRNGKNRRHLTISLANQRVAKLLKQKPAQNGRDDRAKKWALLKAARRALDLIKELCGETIVACSW